MGLPQLLRGIKVGKHNCLTRGVVTLTVAICFTVFGLGTSLAMLTGGVIASTPFEEETTNHYEVAIELQQRIRHARDRQIFRVHAPRLSLRAGGHYLQSIRIATPARPHLIGAGIALLC